jgi:hypothetical protein
MAKKAETKQNQLATVLGEAVSFVRNEALVLARYEMVQDRQFANL